MWVLELNPVLLEEHSIFFFFFLKIYSTVGGEALDPVKVLCPSIGECQGQE
jgi:hypothetical protein